MKKYVISIATLLLIVSCSFRISAALFDELSLIRVLYMVDNEEVATDLGRLGIDFTFEDTNSLLGGGIDAFKYTMFQKANSWKDINIVYFMKHHLSQPPDNQKEAWLAIDSDEVTPTVSPFMFNSFNGGIDLTKFYYKSLIGSNSNSNTAIASTQYVNSYYKRLDLNGTAVGKFAKYMNIGFGEVNLGIFEDSNVQYVDMYLYYFKNNQVQNGGGPVTVIRTMRNGSTMLLRPEAENTSPIITTLSPQSGYIQGGDRIVISGRNFFVPLQVEFDESLALLLSSDQNQIICSSPAHDAGIVDVTVINMDGQSVTLEHGFTYEVMPPELTISMAIDVLRVLVKAQPENVPYDINKDGKIGPEDALLILQKLSGKR